MSGQRLVVFDLGRVLIRICNNWQHGCDVAGVARPELRPPDPDAQARQQEAIRLFDTGRIDLAEFARRYAPGHGLTAEQVVRIQNAYLLGPFAGALELIDDLHAAGHATACLSNTNANHWRLMTDPANDHAAIVSRLRMRFGSHLLGTRKPDPEIYAHVERESRTPPQSIVFFDDMAENVAAARQRGWTAHVVEICDNPIPAIREQLRYDGLLP